jgi:hypothetical protein
MPYKLKEKNYTAKEIYVVINANIKYLTYKQFIILHWWVLFNKRRANKFVAKINNGMAANFAFKFAKKF